MPAWQAQGERLVMSDGSAFPVHGSVRYSPGTPARLNTLADDSPCHVGAWDYLHAYHTRSISGLVTAWRWKTEVTLSSATPDTANDLQAGRRPRCPQHGGGLGSLSSGRIADIVLSAVCSDMFANTAVPDGLVPTAPRCRRERPRGCHSTSS